MLSQDWLDYYLSGGGAPPAGGTPTPVTTGFATDPNNPYARTFGGAQSVQEASDPYVGCL